MSKGPRVSEGKKRLIALDLVAGKPLEEIAQTFHITLGAIARLRREDETFRELEKELAGVLIEEAQRKLRSLVGKAVETLEEIAQIDHTLTPQGAAKILTEKRRAAGDILRWACELKTLGEDPEDALGALLREKTLGIIQQETRPPKTQDHSSYRPPRPPSRFFQEGSESRRHLEELEAREQAD